MIVNGQTTVLSHLDEKFGQYKVGRKSGGELPRMFARSFTVIEGQSALWAIAVYRLFIAQVAAINGCARPGPLPAAAERGETSSSHAPPEVFAQFLLNHFLLDAVAAIHVLQSQRISVSAKSADQGDGRGRGESSEAAHPVGSQRRSVVKNRRASRRAPLAAAPENCDSC